MNLKFIYAPNHIVSAHTPGEFLTPGDHKNYVGLMPSKGGYTPSPVPFEVQEDSPLGARLIKVAKRDKSIRAFNEYTAQRIGATFVQYEYSKSQKDWIVQKAQNTQSTSEGKNSSKMSK